jgi:hypothetical protein
MSLFSQSAIAPVSQLAMAPAVRSRQGVRQGLFHVSEKIRLEAIPYLRITSTKNVVFIARSKDEWDLPGQKRVRHRISHCAAEIDVHDRQVDLGVGNDRLHGFLD